MEVIVILPQKKENEKENILEIIEKARDRYGTKTPEEIDRQLRAERDAWDS